jgi:hypothetical protein
MILKRIKKGRFGAIPHANEAMVNKRIAVVK